MYARPFFTLTTVFARLHKNDDDLSPQKPKIQRWWWWSPRRQWGTWVRRHQWQPDTPQRGYSQRNIWLDGKLSESWRDKMKWRFQSRRSKITMQSCCRILNLLQTSEIFTNKSLDSKHSTSKTHGPAHKCPQRWTWTSFLLTRRQRRVWSFVLPPPISDLPVLFSFSFLLVL